MSVFSFIILFFTYKFPFLIFEPLPASSLLIATVLSSLNNSLVFSHGTKSVIKLYVIVVQASYRCVILVVAIVVVNWFRLIYEQH